MFAFGQLGRMGTTGGSVTSTGIVRVGGLSNEGVTASLTGTISLSGLTILEDDILIVSANHAPFTDQTFAFSGNNSGAATKFADLYADDSSDTNLGAAILVQGAVVDTSITFTIGTNSVFSYAVVQYRGVDTTTPLDVAVVSATGIDTDAANPPAITPATADAKIVAIYAAAIRGGGAAWDAPANVENFIQASTTATHPVRVAMADADWAGGAFNPTAVGTKAVTASGASWAAVSLALRPAA